MGNFLYILAAGSVAWMIIGPMFSGSFYLDASPVFNICAGRQLNRRSNPARLWVISVYTFAAFVALMIVLLVLTVGVSNANVRLGSLSLPDQPYVVVPLAMSFVFLCLYPVSVLTNRDAVRQFKNNGETKGDEKQKETQN
jgi:hypothetical protein